MSSDSNGYQSGICRLLRLVSAVLAVICLLSACEDCGDCNCPTCETTPVDQAPVVVVPDDVADIQAAIDSALPTAGGTIFIRSGVYRLTAGIHIGRSNVSVVGEPGVLLTLAAGVNQPVVLVGTDAQVPARRIENISITQIEIDGNRAEQTSETDPARPWIYNNGIDVRMVSDLNLEDLDIYNTRSGGIVVSWKSERLFVGDCSLHENEFDGLALYDSEDILISNILCYENVAAGISLDADLRMVSFDNGIVRDNGTGGIFVRNSSYLSFRDLMVSGNGEDGCFLSHAALGDESGVTQLCFSSCSFFNNSRYGIWLASPESESPGNSLIGCMFFGNGASAVNVHENGFLTQSGCVFL